MTSLDDPRSAPAAEAESESKQERHSGSSAVGTALRCPNGHLVGYADSQHCGECGESLRPASRGPAWRRWRTEGALAVVALVVVVSVVGLLASLRSDGEGPAREVLQNGQSDSSGLFDVAGVVPTVQANEMIVLASPFDDDTTLFTAATTHGALVRVSGTRASDGSIRSLEEEVITLGGRRAVYRYAADGLVTGLDLFDELTGESVALAFDYGADHIQVQMSGPTSAVDPLEFRITEEQMPGLRATIASIRARTSREASDGSGSSLVSLQQQEDLNVRLSTAVTDPLGPVNEVGLAWELRMPASVLDCRREVLAELEPLERRTTVRRLCGDVALQGSFLTRTGQMMRPTTGDGVYKATIRIGTPDPLAWNAACAKMVDSYAASSVGKVFGIRRNCNPD